MDTHLCINSAIRRNCHIHRLRKVPAAFSHVVRRAAQGIDDLQALRPLIENHLTLMHHGIGQPLIPVVHAYKPVRSIMALPNTARAMGMS
jgi:hypothetical protein